MTATFGNKVKVTIFGESHGSGIGVVVDGLPPGEEIDLEVLQDFMNRRAPGRNAHSTARKEADEPKILSGLFRGVTTGSPLSALIENTDQRSTDYDAFLDVPRPSHADWVARCKYGGHMDMRGGGPFSGRLTAPLCVAGGIAKQILARRGVTVAAHLLRVGGVEDRTWDPVTASPAELEVVAVKEFPVVDDEQGRRMKEEIESYRKKGDSVGGVLRCMSLGLPAGLGEPNCDGVESLMAKAIFAIPGVRGISFGTGFAAAAMTGSEHNDPIVLVDGEIRTATNHAGGVVGGITNAMPLYFDVAVKPTASIAMEQQSVKLSEKKPQTLVVGGRHDPCIAPRAVPVVEAVCALVILDLWEGAHELGTDQK